MNVISIKYCDIPLWLKVGDFYRNLRPGDTQDSIEIPTDCFTQEHDFITDNDDVEHFHLLIRTIMYWLLDEIPVGVLQFCVRYDLKFWHNAILSIPGARESKTLAPLFDGGSDHLPANHVLFKIIIKRGDLELILEAAKTLQDANAATAMAAKEGNLLVLKYLHEQGLGWNEQTCWEASTNGHLDCLQYAHESGCPWDYLVYRKAAYFGHLHCMQYAHQQGLNEWHTEVCAVAAQEGQLACLQFAHENSCPWDYQVYSGAAHTGDVHIMEYAYRQGLEWHENVCDVAAAEGHLDCLQFARENGCPWNSMVHVYAAGNGRRHIMQYAHRQGLQWQAQACSVAAQEGHLNCLQYAHENGCPWDGEVYTWAARCGHLHIMQYAYEQGLEWHENVCKLAAMNGHLACLQFAHVNGCSWNSMAVRGAAQEGQLSCLQYLLEQGCPIHEEACNMASLEGHLLCLKLLHAHNASWNETTSWHATCYSDVSCLQYLRDNGCPWDYLTAERAAQNEHIAPLRYAMEQGCPYSYSLLHSAILSGNIENLQLLVEEQGLYVDEILFVTALLRGNLICLQYLLDHGCPFLGAIFFDAASEVEKYERVFVKDNPEFTQCVRLAVERGWIVDFIFCKYVRNRDKSCVEYLQSEGLFVDSISVKFCEIPTWLQAGAFYRNLSADDPEDVITIPADCFAVDNSWTHAFSEEDFCRLVRSSLFWALDEIPVGVLEFCDTRSENVWQRAMKSVAGAEESTLFSQLIGVYPLAENADIGSIIATGRLELILHAARRMKDSFMITSFAAQAGNLLVLQHLHEQGFSWDERTCWRASKNGHLDCLQYAHENGCPWNAEVYEWAAQHGHVHIIQYAHQQGLEWCVCVFRYAALNGDLACLKFAHENGCPWDGTATRNSAQIGHVACLRYLLEHGCPIHERACVMACSNGHLPCLQLLHQFGAPWNEAACYHAAGCTEVHCLQYLYENDCPWDKETVLFAAQKGKINTLRYALDRNCPYDVGVMVSAVRSGSMECVQFVLEEQLLSVDETSFRVALLKGNVTCLQYLIDQGCPYLGTVFQAATDNVEIYDQIFVKDNPEFTQCVQYAVERGWEVDVGFCEFVSTRDVKCTEYLRSEGLLVESSVDELALIEAVLSGETTKVRSLFERRCLYVDNLVEYAVCCGRTDCLQYLVEDQMLDMSWEVFTMAVLKGSLSCLQYLTDQGCSYLGTTFTDINQDLEYFDQIFVKNNPEFTQCVRYAVERGWKVDAAFCEYISSRDAECVTYLRSEGLFALQDWYLHHVPVDGASVLVVDRGRGDEDHCVQYNALRGNAECVQYLVEDQLPPYDKHVFRTALLKGNLSSVQYLIDHGCPYMDAHFSNEGCQVDDFDKMFIKDNPEFTMCVRYAVEHGWNVDAAFCEYISSRDAMCTDYLLCEGLYIEG